MTTGVMVDSPSYLEAPMKRILQGGVLLLSAGLLVGCGGSDNEQVIKDTISTMNSMADVMEKSKTADDAKSQLEPLVTKLQDLKSRAEKMKGTKAEDEALQKKYMSDLMNAAMRFAKAGQTLAQTDPKGFMDKIQPLLQKVK